jgi:hypothetical protein
MRRATGISLAIFAGLACLTYTSRAQTSAGMLDITARITPTAARPEPVRQFTLYILTKSYADIAKESRAETSCRGAKIYRELESVERIERVAEISLRLST